MSIGKKILQFRLKGGRTQRDVSELTGLAVSYISRIENGRITPSVHTLEKLSRALEVPLTSFFSPQPALEASDKCPVSLSGRCILDQLFVGRGRKPKLSAETYTAKQLEILRLCNYLLHAGDRKVLMTLEMLLTSMVDFHARMDRKRRKA